MAGTLRVHRIESTGTAAGAGKLRVHRVSSSGTVTAAGKLRVHRVGATGTSSVVVTPIGDFAVEPEVDVELTATLVSGAAADSWTWRRTGGDAITLQTNGPTVKFRSPSKMPPGSVINLGVTAKSGSTTSPEHLFAVTTLPQTRWYKRPGGVWTGSPQLGVPVPPPPPPPTGGRAVSYATVTEARAALGAPSNANYVVWSHGTQTLEQVFRTLGSNDILVLPERFDGFGVPIPYMVDTADGFRALGVTGVDTKAGIAPVRSTYSDTGGTANMWFAMARAKRGIMGMGPGSVIRLSASAFTQAQQTDPPLNVQNPTPDQQRKAYLSGGGTMVLYGIQEKVIESDITDAFFGNFHMYGRDLGGVAFSGIRLNKGGRAVNLYLRGAGSGYSGTPNGEAGGLQISDGPYTIENVEVDGRDETGAEIGSSPIMLIRTSGGTIKTSKAYNHRAGMPVLWNCAGTNTWTDFEVFLGAEVGVNMEANHNSLVLNWTRGKCEAAPGRYHFIVNSKDGTSQRLNINQVAFLGGREGDGVMTAHGYNYGGEAQGQLASMITRDGVAASLTNTGPVRAYGTIH